MTTHASLALFAVVSAAFAAHAAEPQIRIAFPAAHATVAADRQTYVIGAVSPPDSPVTVNGQTVTPWRTGSFLAMVPVTPGTNTLVCQAGTAVLRHPFTVPGPPPAWDGKTLRVHQPLQPLGMYTGETVRLACHAPAGLAVSAAVGERTVPLTAEAGRPTLYAASVRFDAPVEAVPVTFFAPGLGDAPAAPLTARAQWPALRITGPLFETRVRSEPGEGDTVGFPPPGLRLQGAGFTGAHTRLWVDGKLRYVETRLLEPEAGDAALPPRDLALPDLAAAFGPHPPTNRTPASLLIVLDPGHGGPATGALGPSGLAEKEVNLRQARAIKSALEQAGFRVRMTRESDVDVDLYARARIAYTERADAFISIHHNATPPSANPMEARHVSTYAWNEIGLRLARAIHPRLAAVTPIRDRGVMTASFAVCRNPAIPSCLLELDFINCPQGEESIQSPEQQRRVAEAVLAGVREWLAASRPQ